jgi:hypothetical protein
MIRGLIRFGLIWAISLFLTPYVNRLFDRAAAVAPKGSFIEAMMLELSTNYSAALIRSVGETIGELIAGSKD